ARRTASCRRRPAFAEWSFGVPHWEGNRSITKGEVMPPTGPRFVDATRPPGRFRRAYSALTSTRPLLFFSRHVMWKLDPVLLRLTRGRVAGPLVFPTAVLETRGARTGERRRNAV